MSDIFVNQILRVELTVTDENGAVIDLSAVSSISMIFKKPNQTTVTQTPALVTDGTDGKMEYTTDNTDLDIPGKWQVQGIVTEAAGDTPTTIVNFTVRARLG